MTTSLPLLILILGDTIYFYSAGKMEATAFAQSIMKTREETPRRRGVGGGTEAIDGLWIRSARFLNEAGLLGGDAAASA